MSSGYVIPIDPTELASRFPAYDPREDEDNEEEFCEEDESDISTEEMAAYFADSEDIEGRIEPLLERIPEREADLILMYFVHGKRQADIAAIFGVTQAAISYRLDRGIKRIQFLLSIPQVTKDELLRDLPDVLVYRDQPDGSEAPVYPFRKKNGKPTIDVDILVGMWETTCQSEVANRLNLTQGRVRHRFFKAVQILEEAAVEDERFECYQIIFSAISSKKFNILREVKLPQWADRGGDECI